MSRPLVPLVLAIALLAACGGEPPAEFASADEAPPRASSDPYALGTAVTPEGSVPRDAAGNSFRRGGELYLSVNVSGSSTDQEIEVKWLDPNGEVIHRDSMEVKKGSLFAAFSTGETTRWQEGEHRAVIIINGRKVSERPFALI